MNTLKIYLVISKSRMTHMTHVKMYVIKKRISYSCQANGYILHHRWMLSFLAADTDTTSRAVSGIFRISLLVCLLFILKIYKFFYFLFYIITSYLHFISSSYPTFLQQSPFNSTYIFVLPCFIKYYMYMNLNTIKCIGFNAIDIKMSLYICT